MYCLPKFGTSNPACTQTYPLAAAVAMVRQPHTGTSCRCRVCQNHQRRRKTPLTSAGFPYTPSFPHLPPPPLSLPPLPPPPYPLPQATLCYCPHFFFRSPFVCLRTAIALDGVPIDILVPIVDVVVSPCVLVRYVNILSGPRRPPITVLLVVLVLHFFLL